MIRGIVSLGFVALAAAGVQVAAADTVVDQKATAEKGDDGVVTASIEVINTGPDAVPLRPVVVPAKPTCHLTPDPTTVGAGQVTTVTVTIPKGCFDDSTPMAVDLDGVAKSQTMPATVVAPPMDHPTDWAPLWWGLLVGALMAGTVGLRGWTEHEEAQQEAMTPEGIAGRERAYLEVRKIVKVRTDGLSLPELPWKPLPPPTYSLTSELGNLEAGWSFKDSWVANLTVASTALIALLTSADALTAVLGEEPAAALGVMTVAGLVSAVLVGVANTVVKLVGKSVEVVTVGGLIASTSLVVLAAGFQVVTVGLAAASAAGHWPLAAAALLLALLVAAVLEVYAFRRLGETVREGLTDGLPVVPADAVAAWAARRPWERSVVEGQMRATYAEWLEGDPLLDTAEGAPSMAAWTPVARPVAARRRSLL